MLGPIFAGATMLIMLTAAFPGAKSNTMIPVTIRPATTDRPMFTRRSFEPKSTISFCQMYTNKTMGANKGPDLLDCITADHADYKFVDLEQIEPLLEDQRVFCDEKAVLGEKTNVVLPFISRNAMLLARSVWGEGRELIFMAEDPHCFHGAKERSFYLSDHIDWDVDDLTAVIQAQPLFANIFVKSNWAHNAKRHLPIVPEGYFPHPRPSANLSVELNHQYVKRGGTPLKVATAACIVGLFAPVPFGIPACVLGAPYYGIIAAILDAEKVSAHLKAGAILGTFAPPLGAAVAGLGTLFAPTVIEWHIKWDKIILKDPIVLPWGTRKSEFEETKKNLRLPNIVFECPSCHVLGEFKVGINLHFDLRAEGHKGPPECANSEEELYGKWRRDEPQKLGKLSHQTYLEAARLAKHIKRARLENDGHKIQTRTSRHDRHFKRATCPPTDITYPNCWGEEGRRYHEKCDKHLENLLYHPSKVFFGAVGCILNSIGGDTQCWNKFHEAAAYFDSPEHFAQMFMQRHMHEAKFYLHVDKDIDVNLNPKLQFDITTGSWFDVDLGIDSFIDGRPPVISWGYLVQTGGSSSQIFNGGEYAAGFNKGTKDGQNGFGEADHSNNGMGKMTWGIPVIRFEQVLTSRFNATVTLPGFRAKIGKGIFEIDLLQQKDEIVKSTCEIRLEYIKAQVELGEDPYIQASYAVGPAFDFSLTPVLDPRPTGNHIAAPFAFGGAWEWVKLEWKVGMANAWNPECIDRHGSAWTAGGGGSIIGFYVSHGLRLYSSFFGFRVDSSWIGKLSNSPYAVEGLYIRFPLYVHCEHHANIMGKISDKLNEVLDVIQEPIAKAINKLSMKLNALGKEHKPPKNESVYHGLDEEAFAWYHGLVPPPKEIDYTPDPPPETIEQCNVESLPLNLNGPHVPCTNISQNTHYNWTQNANEDVQIFSHIDASWNSILFSSRTYAAAPTPPSTLIQMAAAQPTFVNVPADTAPPVNVQAAPMIGNVPANPVQPVSVEAAPMQVNVPANPAPPVNMQAAPMPVNVPANPAPPVNVQAAPMQANVPANSAPVNM